MRITRTTVPKERDHPQFYHPYPIWIRNRTGRIHNGSIYVEIPRKDMDNCLFECD